MKDGGDLGVEIIVAKLVCKSNNGNNKGAEGIDRGEQVNKEKKSGDHWLEALNNHLM